jgi:hypothetical protein
MVKEDGLVAGLRRLDSNQNDEVQGLAGCRLPHAGPSPGILAFCLGTPHHDTGRQRYCSRRLAGCSLIVLLAAKPGLPPSPIRAEPFMAPSAQPSIRR